IFLANAVYHTDSAVLVVRESHDVPAGTAELALNRHNALCGSMKMSFKKLSKDVHSFLNLKSPLVHGSWTSGDFKTGTSSPDIHPRTAASRDAAALLPARSLCATDNRRRVRLFAARCH